MTSWYLRPAGEGLVLRTKPRLASWNKASDPDQIALGAYLDDTEDLVAPSVPPSGLWSLWLSVGLPPDRKLTDTPDVDNLALPLASRLANDRLASVWCSKRHADTSFVIVEPARKTQPPLPSAQLHRIRTTASVASVTFKQQVRSGLGDTAELSAEAVSLQIAFVVGPKRNWLNLWKPTIDALDPLLGRTYPGRDWHPKDGRIADIGLHLAIDASIGDAVELVVAAGAVPT